MVTVAVGDQGAFMCSAGSATQFMRCLNQTSGLDVPVVLTIEGDILLKPEDWQPYAAWMPIVTGNSTVTVTGPRLPDGSGYATPILDFGGVLALSFHSAGTAWLLENLVIQGLATHSAGYAATGPNGNPALGFEMVNGIFWPSTVGQPGHLMAFRNLTLVSPTPCNENDTQFLVASLLSEAKWDTGIDVLPDGGYIVREMFNGTFPVRDIVNGGSVGNVRYSRSNMTVTCPPEPATAMATPQAILPAANSSTVIAGSCQELAYYLGTVGVTDILVARPIKVNLACLSNTSLPIVVSRGRNLTLRSNDGQPRVLDFGQVPYLLAVEDTASLTFRSMILQGVAFPSSVYQNRSTMLDGSPVWPTIDGQPGHVMSFEDCYLHQIKTPCSTKSTQVEIELLQRAVGQDGVQRVGDTTYTILKPTVRMVYTRDLTTQQQLFPAKYTFNETTISCLEDPGVALAPELLGNSSGDPAAAAGSGSSSHKATILGAVIGVVAACMLVTAVVGALVVRRRRRQRVQGTQDAKMRFMESGERPSPEVPLFAKDGHATPEPLDVSANCSAAAKNALWRSKFGVIDGLEVGELLGRGSYGRVYKGRWNGALVAIKVVEHRVLGGKAYDLSREPLLSLSVSHPNCITTYKLSVVRVLSAEGEHELSLPSSEGPCSEMHSGRTSLGAATVPGCLSQDEALKAAAAAMESAVAAAAAEGDDALDMSRADSAGSGSTASGSTPPRPAVANSVANSSAGGSSRTSSGRRLHSLLSGAAAVEIASTNEVLVPGLYETWIVCEYCDQKTLQEAIAAGRMRQPGSGHQPDLMSVYLCLLDIALGLEYLHNDLNILHGDLKPANVLLKGARNDRRGFVCKLADFGLSRLLGAQDTGVDTSSCGTPSHAAPEVLSQSRMTKHGDVYAFGIIAWELVAGEDPYPGMLAVQIILQVVQHGYRPARPDFCPDPLWELMQRCWASEPHNRPSFSEVVEELKVQIIELRKGNTPASKA
ncbi:hypothetical protein N2152v2_002045 [Parachlorella kessleri]